MLPDACLRRARQRASEKLGYRLEESETLSADGKEIPGAVVMVDAQANYGHYDELTALTGMTFLACGSPCPGAYGDHLIVLDGKEWHQSVAPHESNYPARRGGIRIRDSDADDARKYWRVYWNGSGRDHKSCPERGSPCN